MSRSEEWWQWNDDGGECSCAVREASCSRQCCSILPADTTSSRFDTAFSTATSDLYTQRRMSGVKEMVREIGIQSELKREAYLVSWVCDSVLWSRDCRGWTRLVVSSTVRQCICLAKTYHKLNSAIQNSIIAAFNFSLGDSTGVYFSTLKLLLNGLRWSVRFAYVSFKMLLERKRR